MRFFVLCFVFSFSICIAERLLFYQGGPVPSWLHPINGFLGMLSALAVEGLFHARSIRRSLEGKM